MIFKVFTHFAVSENLLIMVGKNLFCYVSVFQLSSLG